MNLYIISAVFTGLVVYYRRAINRQIYRIDEFFLAGRNIGKKLFTISTWGNSLGFGNSMFVALWAGYSWGLAGIWIQGIWALGMILYGRLIPYILKHTNSYTLHGYLGATYGVPVKNITAFVSLTGLLVCIGFELTFFGEFFSAILGKPESSAISVLLFGFIVATFCTIGGYAGNVALDRICIRAACIAMGLFLAALMYYHPGGWNVFLQKDAGGMVKEFIVPHISIYEFTGFAVFTLFQLIDMTNWQTVSANSLPDKEEEYPQHVNGMRRAIKFSAIAFMFFPAIAGTLIGYYFHNINPDSTQQNLMLGSVTASLPGEGWTRTILLSLLLFGFLSSSLACTNSWLLASVQTLSWDLFDFKTLKSVNFKVSMLSDEIHTKVINRAKVMIYVVGAGGTAVIYYIYKNWDQIFSLQFMMFGAGLSMLPAFIYGVVIKKTDKLQSPAINRFGLASIALGFATAVGIFVYAFLTKNSDLSGLIPPAVLIVSSLVFSLGLINNNRYGTPE
jgi:hypothetical protein